MEKILQINYIIHSDGFNIGFGHNYQFVYNGMYYFNENSLIIPFFTTETEKNEIIKYLKKQHFKINHISD